MASEWKIPSLEEIYEEFHRERFKADKGVYPRRLKKFAAVEEPSNHEFLVKFQNMVKRNRHAVNWKTFIKANAETLGGKLDLRSLCSLKGMRVYKGYIQCRQKRELACWDIIDEVKRSLAAIGGFCEAEGVRFAEYFKYHAETSPVALQHLYADTVSPQLYACMPSQMAWRMLDFSDDCYYDLFECPKGEFFETIIDPLHDYGMRFAKVRALSSQLEQGISAKLSGGGNV